MLPSRCGLRHCHFVWHKQQEYEAEQQRREELRKTQAAMFDQIVARAPEGFTSAQLRFVLCAFLQLDPYCFLEDAVGRVAQATNEMDKSDEELLIGELDSTADDRLIGFALLLALASHLDIPPEADHDLLVEAQGVFPAASRIMHEAPVES